MSAGRGEGGFRGSIIRERGQKASGLEVEQARSRGASPFRLRDGKDSGLVLYWYRVRAFADLGLTPDTGTPARSLLLPRWHRCVPT